MPEGSRDDSQIISHNHRGDDQVSADPFGPLKIALESTSAIYAQYEVPLRQLAEYLPTTDASAGDRRRQK